MTFYDPWEVLTILIGFPVALAVEILILAALPKQAREIIMVTMAVLAICVVPQALLP